MLAALPDYVFAAPASFLVGAAVGFWIGARFDVRKKSDLCTRTGVTQDSDQG